MDVCINADHYPHPEPPTLLTADPRLHWYDAPSPCYFTAPAAIGERVTICELGHLSRATLAGDDDVALCAHRHRETYCRRLAFAIDGIGAPMYRRLMRVA